jgi:choline dehydrogenase
MQDKEFDFIIVGSGSAGSVLASRLSEDPANSVLVIEFGGRDNSIFIKMPSACYIPMSRERFDWGFESEPEPRLNGRRILQPRGKVIGGTSSINGMCYVRGHAGDYDEWEELGATGWNYANCLPYFKRAEDCSYGGDNYRGDSGPIGICNGTDMANPLHRAFIDAGAQAGYLHSDDVNGYQQEGFGRMDMTIKNGERSSTATAYLKPAMRRPNLTVEMHALTHRVLMEGKRAVGVEYSKGGQVFQVKARREVILSAGPVNSPKLLMLSGIGDSAQLNEHGIETVHHLPGVGENLHDHLSVWIQQECTQPITLNGRMGLLSKAMIGLRWILFRDGLGATNHYESNGYIRSRPGLSFPDIQYHFLAGALVFDGSNTFEGHGYGALFNPAKPKSRGRVRLQSSDAAEKPTLLFNYLDHEDDRALYRLGVKLTREILAQAPFDPYRGREINPGAEIQSDDEIDAWVADNAKTCYHPCGTCKMGVDPAAVVDPQTRVHGVEGLRVVDSSIMPYITNGNLNGPTIMMGERASDLILGKDPLPPSNAPAHYADDWRNSQRAEAPLRTLARS